MQARREEKKKKTEEEKGNTRSRGRAAGRKPTLPSAHSAVEGGGVVGPLHRPAPGGQAPWVAVSGFEPASAFNYIVHLLDQGSRMEDGRVGDSGERSRLRRRRAVWELSGDTIGPCFCPSYALPAPPRGRFRPTHGLS